MSVEPLLRELGSSLIESFETRPGSQPFKAPAALTAWEHALGAQRARWRIWKYMEVYKGGPNPPCAQARMARTAREHKALMARNMMSHHTCSHRPSPTCKTSIVVTATIFTLFKANIRRWRPPPQKRWRGLRPRYLFCGFLCIGFK